jgi:protein involved in polysaccharide export with SLBB domain
MDNPAGAVKVPPAAPVVISVVVPVAQKVPPLRVAVGDALTVTTVAAEEAEHPATLVTVTE